jgi:hypothetical protein
MYVVRRMVDRMHYRGVGELRKMRKKMRMKLTSILRGRCIL